MLTPQEYKIHCYVKQIIESFTKDFVRAPSDFYGNIDNALKVAKNMCETQVGLNLIYKRPLKKKEIELIHKTAEEHAQFLKSIYELGNGNQKI